MKENNKSAIVKKEKFRVKGEQKKLVTNFELNRVASKIEGQVNLNEKNKVDIKIFEME